MSKCNQWAFANTVLLASIGWFIGGDVAWALVEFSLGLDFFSDSPGFMIGFTIGGMMTGYSLRLAEPSISWKHISWIIIGWSIGLAIGGTCGFAILKEINPWLVDQTKFLYFPIRSRVEAIAIGNTIGRTIWLGITFIIGGGVIGYTLHTLGSLSIRKKQIAWIAIGWSGGFPLGKAISYYIICPMIVWTMEIFINSLWARGLWLVVLGIMVRLIWPAFSWTHAALIAIKWVVSIALGLLLSIMVISSTLFFLLSAVVLGRDELGVITLLGLFFYPPAFIAGISAIPNALGFAIGGGIGFSITLRCIR